jgi:hypothetical protein
MRATIDTVKRVRFIDDDDADGGEKCPPIVARK